LEIRSLAISDPRVVMYLLSFHPVDQGHTVFVISWANPDERLAQKSFEHYMEEGVLAALEGIRR
jgi:poly(3-hydroxyalkanoate) synthetase